MADGGLKQGGKGTTQKAELKTSILKMSPKGQCSASPLAGAHHLCQLSPAALISRPYLILSILGTHGKGFLMKSPTEEITLGEQPCLHQPLKNFSSSVSKLGCKGSCFQPYMHTSLQDAYTLLPPSACYTVLLSLSGACKCKVYLKIRTQISL